jgi:aspartate-semialdehyde dehydrogenase
VTDRINVGVLGATGMVGQQFISRLAIIVVQRLVARREQAIRGQK